MNQPALTNILPHGPEAILLSSVEASTHDSIHCQVRLTQGSPYMTNDRVRNLVAVEYMAQAIAAHVGMRRLNENSQPRVGYVVSVRSVDFTTSEFLAGDTLDVTMKCEFENAPAAQYTGQIARDGEILCTGTLTVVDAPEQAS